MLHMRKIKHNKFIHILVFILLIIYVISFFNLNFRNDEGFTMALIHHSFLNIIRIDSYDVHPPLYYLVLKFFLNITTFWTNSLFIKILFARLFSFISFLLSIILLTKIFYSNNFLINRGSIYFIILFPSVLFFATQIRMYSFGAFLIILGYYIYNKFLIKRFSLINLIIFFLCMVAISYTQYYYALYAGLFILVLGVISLNRRKYIRCLIYLLLDILLCLSYIPWLFYSMGKLSNTNHIPMYTLKKLIVQICKIVLIPTGLIDSSLNSMNLICKVIFIGIIYYLIAIGFIWMKNNLSNNLKLLFIINIIISIIISVMGVISDLSGYEFSVRFLYPSFLIFIYFIIISLWKVDKKRYFLFLIIIALFTACISINLNINNFNTSINVIRQYKQYNSIKRYIYIPWDNDIDDQNKLSTQMLISHRVNDNTDKATLLMYMNKNMLSNHKINNSVEYKVWNNIK